MPTSPPDLVPVSEAAELLGKSVRSVHRLIKSGDLTPVLKVSGGTGAYLLDRADVVALVESQQAVA